jgi:hypothetical protein
MIGLRRLERVPPVLNHSAVIAGLDPGLDPAIHILTKMMDARVKPAHDEEAVQPDRNPL